MTRSQDLLVQSSTHSSSGGFQSLSHDDVKRWILKDIELYDSCDIDTLLQVFLDPSSALVALPPLSSSSSDKSLLHDWLKAVLPICNSKLLKEKLEKFCNTEISDEVQRYPLFCDFCNHAIERLKSLAPSGEVSYSSPGKSLDILFHVNDPVPITSLPIHGAKTQYKPDVVITSLAAARRTQSNGFFDATWRDFSNKLASRRPISNFGWFDIFSAVEFKVHNKRIPTRPPNEYDDTALKRPVETRPLLRGVGDGTIDADRVSEPASEPAIITSSPQVASAEQLSGGAPSFSAPKSRQPDAKTVPRRSPRSTTVTNTARSEQMAERGSRLEETGVLSPADSSPHNDPKKEDPAVQCGKYAAEMLRASTGKSHVINLLCIDDKVWVWWYDRQGAIQSTGINFVADLPRFLVLLVAFQRFSLENWGFNIDLDPEIQELHLDAGHQFSGRTFEKTFEPFKDYKSNVLVSIDPSKVGDRWHRYGITGRSTRVLEASSNSFDPRTGVSLIGMRLVVKISWPNEQRSREDEIISDLLKVADDLGNHLPGVVTAAQDCYKTSTIRNRLSIAGRPLRPARVLRVIVFEYLDEITTLRGKDLVMAWRQCLQCHFVLWKAGHYHRDLSLSNLMIRTRQGQRFGVLNDWDLSFKKGGPTTYGDLTATIPFLAIDLLDPASGYWDGTAEVLYRHELECFIWIIVWVFMCYDENGKERPPLDLLGWKTGHYDVCFKEKGSFLGKRDHASMVKWHIEWPLGQELLYHLYDARNPRKRKSTETDEPDKYIREIHDVFNLIAAASSDLQYLVEPTIPKFVYTLN